MKTTANQLPDGENKNENNIFGYSLDFWRRQLRIGEENPFLGVIHKKNGELSFLAFQDYTSTVKSQHVENLQSTEINLPTSQDEELNLFLCVLERTKVLYDNGESYTVSTGEIGDKDQTISHATLQEHLVQEGTDLATFNDILRKFKIITIPVA